MILLWFTEREGIAFAIDEGEAEVSDYRPPNVEDGIEERLSSYEKFAQEEFRKPEHRHLVVGLRLLSRSLTKLRESWQQSDRGQALFEIENLLKRQHEIELQVEKIDNMYLREYVHDLLDKIAAARRAISEEIRWDVEVKKSSV